MTNSTDEQSCFDCRFFTQAIGEKGYCTLYHHETVLPEKICPRFEQIENNETVNTSEPQKVDDASRKFDTYLVVGAFFASFILSAFAFIILLVFGKSIIVVGEIPDYIKVILISAASFLLLLFFYFLLRFGKKYTWARIVEMVLALIACIVALIYFNSIIFSANDVIANIIEKIINVL